MTTTACTKLIKAEFPSMDLETIQYIEGILTGSADDFESGDDLYDAIGDLLHEIAVEKDEDDVRYVYLQPAPSPNSRVPNNGFALLLFRPPHPVTCASSSFAS